ncbi:MAG: polysaccharide deacetylase family protein [Clostridia bacterium]|nr:polysaccharide deacetylase family protein [Clostridia bacterium]
MWNGKKKAVTFSFDDGVTQDRYIVEILNKYKLKATFNINSGLLGLPRDLTVGDKTVSHNKVLASEVESLYDGHEIAVHTLTHPGLPSLDDQTIIRQVELDRELLERLCGYPVCGMAYPGGGKNHDERVANVIKNNTPIEYARTITSTYSFDLQNDLSRFNPTVQYTDGKLFDLLDDFLSSEQDKPQLFYIWGHSYEIDLGLISKQKFEEFCKKISGKDDIFYGTNRQVLLNR